MAALGASGPVGAPKGRGILISVDFDGFPKSLKDSKSFCWLYVQVWLSVSHIVYKSLEALRVWPWLDDLRSPNAL